MNPSYNSILTFHPYLLHFCPVRGLERLLYKTVRKSNDKHSQQNKVAVMLILHDLESTTVLGGKKIIITNDFFWFFSSYH